MDFLCLITVYQPNFTTQILMISSNTFISTMLQHNGTKILLWDYILLFYLCWQSDKRGKYKLENIWSLLASDTDESYMRVIHSQTKRVMHMYNGVNFNAGILRNTPIEH